MLQLSCKQFPRTGWEGYVNVSERGSGLGVVGLSAMVITMRTLIVGSITAVAGGVGGSSRRRRENFVASRNEFREKSLRSVTDRSL